MLDNDVYQWVKWVGPMTWSGIAGYFRSYDTEMTYGRVLSTIIRLMTQGKLIWYPYGIHEVIAT